MTIRIAESGLPEALGEDREGLLRLSLKLDAVVTGAAGVLLLAGGPALAGALGAPAGLPRPVGAFLAAYAAAIWLAGSRPRAVRPAARAAVALNLLWVADSIALLAAGWFPLTGPGVAFVVAQAVAVALFADLQLLGLRRARPAIG